MMGGLNGDWVLFASLGTIVLSTVVAVIWGWKTFKAMEGMETNS